MATGTLGVGLLVPSLQMRRCIPSLRPLQCSRAVDRHCFDSSSLETLLFDGPATIVMSGSISDQMLRRDSSVELNCYQNQLFSILN